MAPIKFEEHIKEKLDQRQIQPSADSWNKLNNSLNKTDRGEKKFSFWLPSIAAVIVLMISGLLFIDFNKNNSVEIVNTPVIENPSEETEKNETHQPVEVASEENNRSPVEEVNTKKNTSGNASLDSKQSIAATETEKEIQEEENFTAQVSVNETVVKTPVDKKVSEGLQGILAQLSELKSENGEVTNAEVDALLAQAATEINKNKKLAADDHITADALLADVEEEVYESFKEKVFEMVKTGYQKAAVAVSNKLDSSQNQ